MANEEEGQQPPQDDAAQKGGLAKEWRKLATWQKAGVVIAGVGVVAALIYYVNHQATPTSTGNDTLTGTPNGATTGAYGLPTGSYTGYPGEGDQYPPVPVSQPTQPTQPAPTPVAPPTNPVQPMPIKYLPPPGPGAPGTRIPLSSPAAAAPQRTITPMPARQQIMAMPTRPTGVLGGIHGNRIGVSLRTPAPTPQPIRKASGISAAQWNAIKGRI